MNFAELEHMCTRSARYCLNKTKLALASCVIVLCGLLVVFCQSMELFAGAWVAFTLTFLPLFASGGLLMGLGVVLIRSYHDEVKKIESNFWKLFLGSWHAALSSAYVFMPIVLVFLSIWATLGLFYLFREIPIMGEHFASLLSSGPFLLHLSALLLCLFSIYVLFVVTPNFALKPFGEASQLAQEKTIYATNLFFRIASLLVALLPLALSAVLLIIAARMTTHGYVTSSNYVQTIMQWVMIMVPFAMLLSPAVIFFFNMAAETHVFMHKAKAEK
jgi:hypothetical protein